MFISGCRFYYIYFNNLRNLMFPNMSTHIGAKMLNRKVSFVTWGVARVPICIKKEELQRYHPNNSINQVHTNALTHSDQWWKLIYNSVSEQRGSLITGLNDIFLPEYQHFISFVLCIVPMINLCLIKWVVLNNFFLSGFLYIPNYYFS